MSWANVVEVQGDLEGGIPMQGLQTGRTAQIVIAGHAFIQDLRRDRYELGVDATPALRVAAAVTELAQAI